LDTNGIDHHYDEDDNVHDSEHGSITNAIYIA
jgi:hypothetical protein